MTRLPRIKGKEVIRALERAGFTIERTRGSHFFLKDVDGRATAVPLHQAKPSALDCSVEFSVMLK